MTRTPTGTGGGTPRTTEPTGPVTEEPATGGLPARPPASAPQTTRPTASATKHPTHAGSAPLSLILPPLLVVTAVLAVWQYCTRAAAVDPTVLPSPWRVLSQGWENRQDLWDATLPTLQETVAGFGMSFAAAWLVAVLLDFSTWARRGLYPLLVASQTIPVVAVAPLLIIWFGFGLFPKMLVVTLATFFPLTANLAAGFASADPEAMRLLRSLGAGRTRTFLMVRVPSAMPYFFAGLRVSVTYAVVGAVFAEYAGAENGLGIYMQAQKSAFRTDLVFAAVAVTAALSIALFAATYLVERLALPWNRTARRKEHP
ncbi:ABC transporter permease [Streptomyces phaeofaciens JCM 4814]|uniref:ABC transporter permease n=1 Tax=Streptomyces phaeofaciens TaxID=68254 RepID=A0A918HNC8_9ACTN|nr:ABC transporter permease [Streptomyces phaeofaciens]GGT80118.1 ABC transporter permease [Streptomyces phaeofaciens]